MPVVAGIYRASVVGPGRTRSAELLDLSPFARFLCARRTITANRASSHMSHSHARVPSEPARRPTIADSGNHPDDHCRPKRPGPFLRSQAAATGVATSRRGGDLLGTVSRPGARPHADPPPATV